MTAVREICASNVHARLALAGPDDEIKELGKTFDGLLGRLEAAFEAQRRFVANASHELRAPLARQRTLVEVALGDPDATIYSLRASYTRVLAAVEQQERLIEALLTLARSERSLERREPVDLAAVTDEVLLTRRPEVQRRGLHVDATLASAATMGDPHLVERLVANLVDNAVRHNVLHGRVEIVTGTTAGRAIFAVANSGPVIPPAAVDRLFQPFQRLGAERTGHGTASVWASPSSRPSPPPMAPSLRPTRSRTVASLSRYASPQGALAPQARPRPACVQHPRRCSRWPMARYLA
jgi:signal transduction histidine kinase